MKKRALSPSTAAIAVVLSVAAMAVAASGALGEVRPTLEIPVIASGLPLESELVSTTETAPVAADTALAPEVPESPDVVGQPTDPLHPPTQSTPSVPRSDHDDDDSEDDDDAKEREVVTPEIRDKDDSRESEEPEHD